LLKLSIYALEIGRNQDNLSKENKMKINKFNWEKGWIWDCQKYQRIANWIDIEVSDIWREYTWIYTKKGY